MEKYTRQMRKVMGICSLLIFISLFLLPLKVMAEEVDIVNEESKVTVADIEVADYEKELFVGKTMTLTGKIVPANATCMTITYKSSDTNIATVNSSGEVKGIAKGNVTITMEADGITKSIPMEVKVATEEIAVNSNYLVLKENDTFELLATVKPTASNQNVKYSSMDASIATVSDRGIVTAKAIGSTSIVVTNGELKAVVSVIVNKAVEYISVPGDVKTEIAVNEDYKGKIYSSEYSKVDKYMLKNIYENKKSIVIIDDKYSIKINGEDIVNYENELDTDILLEYEDENTIFTVNKGKELCGDIIISLEEVKGDKLYLYNDVKQKYERITMEDKYNIKITTAGRYMVTDKELDEGVNLVFVFMLGILIVVGGSTIYIAMKRKYWFW